MGVECGMSGAKRSWQTAGLPFLLPAAGNQSLNGGNNGSCSGGGGGSEGGGNTLSLRSSSPSLSSSLGSLSFSFSLEWEGGEEGEEVRRKAPPVLCQSCCCWSCCRAKRLLSGEGCEGEGGGGPLSLLDRCVVSICHRMIKDPVSMCEGE